MTETITSGTKTEVLQELTFLGKNDAILHLSGIISGNEFMERQQIIENRLIDAGIEFNVYIMAFKND